jgi:hypothetical protein
LREEDLYDAKLLRRREIEILGEEQPKLSLLKSHRVFGMPADEFVGEGHRSE